MVVMIMAMMIMMVMMIMITDDDDDDDDYHCSLGQNLSSLFGEQVLPGKCRDDVLNFCMRVTLKSHITH